MQLKNIVDWRIYVTLLSASILSIIAILPYILTLQGEVIRTIPMPLPIALVLITLQSAVLFSVLLFIGLALSGKVGLGAPMLDALFNKKRTGTDVNSIMKVSVSIGMLAGAAIIFADLIFSKLGVALMVGKVPVPIWQGFLASFYGGISEEIVMRLFLMTSIVWILGRLMRPKGKAVDNSFLMWSSIAVASLVFGLGHLPITGAMTAITPLVVIRAIVLNGIGGVVFGWLYWKKGLESAMIAHFFADLVLHVLFPLVLSL